MSTPKSRKEFLEKHPPLTDEEVKKRQKEARLAKDKYTKDMKEIEKNLTGFIDITEPLVDPETDKVLCWLKMPTMMELEVFYTKFGDVQDYEVLDADEKVKYMNRQYELMSKMIVNPDHTANWWKEHSNMNFLKLFSLKIEQMFEEMGGMMENF